MLDGTKQISGVISKLKEMSGDFALGFAHRLDPFRLYLVRNDERPLHVAYIRRFKTLIWTSEREHLAFSLLRNDLEARVYSIRQDHLYCADVRMFNGTSNMRKMACRMEPPKLERWVSSSEEAFDYGQGRLFDFDDLRSAGYLEGSGISERSKIPCGDCEIDFDALKLFYDESRGIFICEQCSFDLHDAQSNQLEREVI